MTHKILFASAAIATLLPVLAMADTAANKATAIDALTATFGKGDIAAVDQYFDAGYIEHNPHIANGTEALKGLIPQLHISGTFKSEITRAIADGDLVALQSRYEGFGPTPMVAFDVLRLKDGKIVEHWDNLTPETAPNPSGHTQLDGATDITDLDKTDANKAMVTDFVTKALINGEHVDFTQYINPTNYVQHNSQVADGLEGFGAFMGEMAAKGISMKYNQVHQVIGEGNFVLTLSDGTFGDQAQAFYDLFRVEDGLIVEHWDVISAMPDADAPHNDAGKF